MTRVLRSGPWSETPYIPAERPDQTRMGEAAGCEDEVELSVTPTLLLVDRKSLALNHRFKV